MTRKRLQQRRIVQIYAKCCQGNHSEDRSRKCHKFNHFSFFFRLKILSRYVLARRHLLLTSQPLENSFRRFLFFSFLIPGPWQAWKRVVLLLLFTGIINSNRRKKITDYNLFNFLTQINFGERYDRLPFMGICYDEKKIQAYLN